MLSKTIWGTVQKPSELIDKVMGGEIDLSDQSGPIRSACSRYIYEDACKVLELPTKDERRVALDKVPVLLRPYVEKEVKRVWNLRKR
jgi:hypothetical protein